MKNKFILLVNLVVLVVLAVALWYGYGQSQELKTLYQQLNAGAGQSSEVKNWQILLTETTAERELINRSIITTDLLPGFIDRLETLATSTGNKLELSNVVPGNKNNPNIKLDFRASGYYRNIFYFTALLNSLPAQLEFDRVEFNRRDVSGNKKSLPEWQAQFAIELLNDNTANEKK